MRTIEIDFDVHKAIENERRGFDESPNDALRRLLGLPEDKSFQSRGSAFPAKQKDWTDKGVILPHGTDLRMEYSGRTYIGKILNGEWVIGDMKFDSPSGAASGVALTKKGKRTRLDGWKYWFVRRPLETSWVFLENLRPTMTILDPDKLSDEDFRG
ncbi:MAG: hypothetical protein AB7U61_13080 [Methylocystis sp.]